MSTRLVNDDDGIALADKLRWATRAIERAHGLIGRPPLAPGEALVIRGGKQVHTFGVRGSIDVLFCDEKWSVRHVVRAMPPRRITRWVSGARTIIELPAGRADNVRVGSTVSIRD